MTTRLASSTLDYILAEVALREPRPQDPVAQRRLPWLSEQQRHSLWHQVHRTPEALAGAFLAELRRARQLYPEALRMLEAGHSVAVLGQDGIPERLEAERLRTSGARTIRAQAPALAARTRRRDTET